MTLIELKNISKCINASLLNKLLNTGISCSVLPVDEMSNIDKDIFINCSICLDICDSLLINDKKQEKLIEIMVSNIVAKINDLYPFSPCHFFILPTDVFFTCHCCYGLDENTKCSLFTRCIDTISPSMGKRIFQCQLVIKNKMR